MPILFDLDQWSHTCGPPDVFVHPAWLSIISFIIIMSEILTKFVNITTISKHNFNFKRQKSKSKFIVALWTCMILKGHCYFQLWSPDTFLNSYAVRGLFFRQFGDLTYIWVWGPWGQFHQHFCSSFYTCRSQKRKKTVKSSVSFCAFGIRCS